MTIQATSMEAYNHAMRTLGARQRQVFMVIKERGPLTNKEISAIMQRPINEITPRCKELRKKGIVEYAGTKIIEGRRSITWKTIYPEILF